jgi:hypothetical protein
MTWWNMIARMMSITSSSSFDVAVAVAVAVVDSSTDVDRSRVHNSELSVEEE